jgi:signal transduction histidine kinase
MAESRSNEQYLAIMKRARPATQSGAGVICLLTIASTWGHWTQFAIAIALHALVYPMNMIFDRAIVPRWGARAELARALFNTGVCSIGYQLIGWPLAVWFWLPFTAFTFDQSARQQSIAVVIIHCVVQGVAAVACGVPILIPIAFSALAYVTWRISDARLAIVREMWLSAERQREELVQAHEDLKAEVAARERMELELRHAQKLEAMGRLAAGVAHEINTPMQFIGDNLSFLKEGVADLLALADQPASMHSTAAGDLEYLRDNMPDALAQATEGVRRVAAIVSSMKQFTHQGNGVVPLDLSQAVRNTVTLASHEHRMVADVAVRLTDLPPVFCHAGEINQLLLNIVVNAAHAISDQVKGTDAKGQITIETSRIDGFASVTIADSGGGIPDDVRDRVFEPFFTTKALGRGTGQGLAIAKAVVDRHDVDLRNRRGPWHDVSHQASVRRPGRASVGARKLGGRSGLGRFHRIRPSSRSDHDDFVVPLCLVVLANEIEEREAERGDDQHRDGIPTHAPRSALAA